MGDDALLRAFVETGDERAFRELVGRYTRIVYAAARRQVRDAHLAEDVTQAVFVLLARKAPSIRGGGAALAGWLVNAARLAALATLREELRRQAREARAAAAAAASTSTGEGGSERNAMSTDLQTAETIVDQALCRLREKDRTAVVLRYLHGKSQREVADAMGISEGAAAQRLSRAVGKLRKFFGASGMTLPSAVAVERVLAELQRAAPPPPPCLADAAARTALARGAGTGLAHAAAAAVLLVLWRKTAATIAVVAAGLVLTLAAARGAAAYLASDGAAAGRTETTTPPPPEGPLRVGIYVSARTALPLPARDNAWYEQFSIADEFRGEPGVDLIPVIEPGTAEQPQQKRLTAYYFPGKAPLDVTDTRALRGLDVIVASRVHTPPVKALESIDRAVRDGTGLFVLRCLGNDGPPISRLPVTLGLRGLATVVPGVGMLGEQEWVVVQSHPVLGSLSPTSSLPRRYLTGGQWGTLPAGVGVPLIRLKDASGLKGGRVAVVTTPTSSPTTRPTLADVTSGDVLYLSAVGKGRVMSCNFDGDIPAEIRAATNNRFVARSVRWLAGRPVE